MTLDNLSTPIEHAYFLAYLKEEYGLDAKLLPVKLGGRTESLLFVDQSQTMAMTLATTKAELVKKDKVAASTLRMLFQDTIIMRLSISNVNLFVPFKFDSKTSYQTFDQQKYPATWMTNQLMPSGWYSALVGARFDAEAEIVKDGWVFYSNVGRGGGAISADWAFLQNGKRTKGFTAECSYDGVFWYNNILNGPKCMPRAYRDWVGVKIPPDYFLKANFRTREEVQKLWGDL